MADLTFPFLNGLAKKLLDIGSGCHAEVVATTPGDLNSILNSIPVKTISHDASGRTSYVEVDYSGGTYRLTWNRDASGNFTGHGDGWELQP